MLFIINFDSDSDCQNILIEINTTYNNVAAVRAFAGVEHGCWNETHRGLKRIKEFGVQKKPDIIDSAPDNRSSVCFAT